MRLEAGVGKQHHVVMAEGGGGGAIPDKAGQLIEGGVRSVEGVIVAAGKVGGKAHREMERGFRPFRVLVDHGGNNDPEGADGGYWGI